MVIQQLYIYHKEIQTKEIINNFFQSAGSHHVMHNLFVEEVLINCKIRLGKRPQSS